MSIIYNSTMSAFLKRFIRILASFALILSLPSLVSSNPGTIDTVVLNSTLGTNQITENLTAYVAVSGNDTSVRLVYIWKLNGTPWASLILPMDGGAIAGGKVREYV